MLCVCVCMFTVSTGHTRSHILSNRFLENDKLPAILTRCVCVCVFVCVPFAIMIHFERTSKQSVFISCAVTPGQSVCVYVIMLCLTESARTCLWEEMFYIPVSSTASKERKHTGPALKDKGRHEQKEGLLFNGIKGRKERILIIDRCHQVPISSLQGRAVTIITCREKRCYTTQWEYRDFIQVVLYFFMFHVLFLLFRSIDNRNVTCVSNVIANTPLRWHI